MKKFTVFVISAMFLFIANVSVAQEWSKEQNEVWKVVKDTWQGWKTGDVNALTASLHDKYQGWSDDSPLPMGKVAAIEWFNSMKESMQIPYFNIEPARIVVLKTAAVVDYYCYFNVAWTEGDVKKSKEIKGKIVEFYVKEGDKWMLLGDMMVHEEVED